MRGTVDVGVDSAPITRAGIAVEPLLRAPFVGHCRAGPPLSSLAVVTREQFENTP